MLDGMRGLAILLVVVFHTFYTNSASGKIARFVGDLIFSGWMGVPIFFVLSGFLIARPFLQSRSLDPQFWYTRGYALRRISKILPPFYLSIAIFSVFYWERFHDTIYLHAAWLWAVGFESYVIPLTNFNLSYWSLMVEAHFYALLPLLFFLTRGLNLKNTLLVVVSAMLIIPFFLRQISWPHGLAVLPDNQTGQEIHFFIDRFPLCLLDYFAFGVAFAGLYVAAKPRLSNCRKLAMFGYAGVALLAFTLCLFACVMKQEDILTHPRLWTRETFGYLPSISGFLMLFFLFDPQCIGARIFSMAWLRFIGIVSYEWFLFHGPMVDWFRHIFGHTNGSPWLFICKTVLPLALSFGFSVLIYYWFSLPILNKVRDRLKS